MEPVAELIAAIGGQARVPILTAYAYAGANQSTKDARAGKPKSHFDAPFRSLVASKLCPEAKAPHAGRKSYFPTSHHATRKTQTLTAMPSNAASTAALLIPPTRRRY